MRDWTRKALWRLVVVIFSVIGWVALPGSADESMLHSSSSLSVEILPLGLSQKEANAQIQRILNLPKVESLAKKGRIRLLNARFGESSSGKESGALPPNSFQLVLYNYSTDQLLKISGALDRLGAVQIRNSNEPSPPPTPEEYAEAYQIIERVSDFGSLGARARFDFYEAMPGVIQLGGEEALALSVNPRERIIAVGLMPRDSTVQHEIVGVSLSSGRILHFKGKAPPTAVATSHGCGPKDGHENNTPLGTPGQAQVIIRNASGQEVWKFVVVRPSVSAGFRGSGIELREVHYRGKKMLSRLHVPILNVKYDEDRCGPYRDWQYSEHPIRAVGEEIASGILNASEKPKTIMDTDDDHGNYSGVAIYAENDSVTLTSELAAGWYRYVNRYIFHEDGRIEPRWGFAAVQDSCSCNTHHHHAYWRMDFDIDGEAANIVQAYDGKNWVTVPRERMDYRDASHQRWRVLHPSTGAGYEIVPGPNDGTASGDSYAAGDVWMLKYHWHEIDDLLAFHSGTRAHLDGFLNDESIENEDSVIWYGAHFEHRPEPSHNLREEHVVGPTLLPLGYRDVEKDWLVNLIKVRKSTQDLVTLVD